MLHAQHYILMLIPRRHFRDFFCGRSGDIMLVAKLPIHIGAYISAMTDRFCMRQESATKILVKHRLTYEQFHIVERAIEKDYCFAGTKQNHLEFIYFDKLDFNKAYLIALKATRDGEEVWLVTFHRTDHQQYRAKRRRQRMYCEHE